MSVQYRRPIPVEKNDFLKVSAQELAQLEQELTLGASFENFVQESQLKVPRAKAPYKAKTPLQPIVEVDNLEPPVLQHQNDTCVWEKLNKYKIKPNHVAPALALRIAEFLENYPFGISISKFETELYKYLGYKPYFGDNISSFKQMVLGETSNEPRMYTSKESKRPKKDRALDIFFTMEHMDILTPSTGGRELIVFPNFGEPSMSIKLSGSLDGFFKSIWNLLLEKRRHLPPSRGPISVKELFDLFVRHDYPEPKLFSNWGILLSTFAWICCHNYTKQYRTIRTNGEPFIEEQTPFLRPRKFEELDVPTLSHIPVICAQPGDEIVGSLSDLINPNEIHEVINAEIFSPDSFGMRKMAHKDDFDDWDSYLNKKLFMREIILIRANPKLLVKGLFVVVRCRNAWARGVIYDQLPFSYFSVYLIDWAGFVNLSWFNINYMPKEFLDMPSFGLWCRLAQNDEYMKQHGIEDEEVFMKPYMRNCFKDELFKYSNKDQRCVYAFKFIKKIEYLEGKVSCWTIDFYTVNPCLGKAGYNSEEDYKICIEVEDVYRWIHTTNYSGGSLLTPPPVPQNKNLPDLLYLRNIMRNIVYLPPKRDKSYNYKHLHECLQYISTLDPAEQNHFIGLNSDLRNHFEKAKAEKLKK